MSVLIVVESRFGNTMRVARALAAGLAETAAEVNLLRCGEAPAAIRPDVRLLLVGAPTHNLRLPSQASSQQALARGATQGDEPGLAEWIGRLDPHPDLRVISFDTVTAGRFSGSAAKSAARLLHGRGFARSEQGLSFIVDATSGPLRDGEEERARAWGASLGVPG
jgi:hypothetical protein